MYNEENNYNAYENGSGTEDRPASGSVPEHTNLWDTPAAEIPNPTGDRNTQSGSYTEPVYTSAVNVEPTYSPNHYGNDYGQHGNDHEDHRKYHGKACAFFLFT